MNDNPAPTSSTVPLVPLRRHRRFVVEVEALLRRAEAEGQGTLAHLLGLALIEARHLAEQGRRDRAERDVDPRDLWRPAGL